MNNKTLMANLRCIPDFPKKGINFRDVTTLFKNPACLQIMVDELYEIYKNKGITKIVGIESRGFVMASALAVKLGAGVVLARKPGKLPAATVQESYAKEYGEDTIEIHEDAINDKDIVLLHDDLLATGGTMKAAVNLVKKFNPRGVFVNFLIEITDEGLHGRDVFDKDKDMIYKVFYESVKGLIPEKTRFQDFKYNTGMEYQYFTPCEMYDNFGKIPSSLVSAIKSGNEATIKSTWEHLSDSQASQFPGLPKRRQAEYHVYSTGEYVTPYEGDPITFSSSTPFSDYLGL